MRITAVEARTYRQVLDPPFAAAWDPVPRTEVWSTLVIVRTDEGVDGFASGGDGLPDCALLERLLTGMDPLRTEAVREVCETVDFHGGRPWGVEIACWDIAGKVAGLPLWRLLGGRSERLTAYVSTGERLPAAARAERCAALVEAGAKAFKLRFASDNWRTDVAVVAEVRKTVGSAVLLMVDANQGWRMPGDRTPRWDVATAIQCARALEPLDVYWLEEPLRSDDPDGYRALRSATSIRLAGGEMIRAAAEARDLIVRGGIDVLQADVVLAGGISGARRLAAVADVHGSSWSPHTWSSGGLGFLANLHAACAFSTCPVIEVPFDPPAWSAERRDFLLPASVAIAGDGTIAPPPGPGLGVAPDLAALEPYRVQ